MEEFNIWIRMMRNKASDTYVMVQFEHLHGGADEMHVSWSDSSFCFRAGVNPEQTISSGSRQHQRCSSRSQHALCRHRVDLSLRTDSCWPSCSWERRPSHRTCCSLGDSVPPAPARHHQQSQQLCFFNREVDIGGWWDRPTWDAYRRARCLFLKEGASGYEGLPLILSCSVRVVCVDIPSDHLISLPILTLRFRTVITAETFSLPCSAWHFVNYCNSSF